MAMLYDHFLHRYFNEQMIDDIKYGNNTKVLSVLKNVENCHLLTDSAGATLLHGAASHGNVWLARYLLVLGTNVDVQCVRKQTPLMAAVEANQESTARLLLEANADIFLPDAYGKCALAMGIANQARISEGIFKALLSRVTVESVNASEYTKCKEFHSFCPIFNFVSLAVNVGVLQALIENGSPVNAVQFQYRKNALHVAVEQLDLDCIKMLVEHNINVNAKDYRGLTPLALVPTSENQMKTLKTINILIAAGARLIDYKSGKIMVKSLLSSGSREIMRTLFRIPIDLEFMDKKGMTSLHYLAMNKHLNILEELQDFEFDINIRCKRKKRTMLHYSVQACNFSSVQFLLESGSDVNVRDSQGRTPLHRAIRYDACFRQDSKHCIRLLLENTSLRIISEEAVYLLDSPWKTQNITLINYIFGHFAIFVASGGVISKFTRNKLNRASNANYKSIFMINQRHLEEMKKIKIDKYVTLFDCLIMSERKRTVYARKKRLFSTLFNITKECTLYSYCLYRLHTRLLELIERQKVVALMNEIFRRLLNFSVESISEKIVSYLHERDLRHIL